MKISVLMLPNARRTTRLAFLIVSKQCQMLSNRKKISWDSYKDKKTRRQEDKTIDIKKEFRQTKTIIPSYYSIITYFLVDVLSRCFFFDSAEK